MKLPHLAILSISLAVLAAAPAALADEPVLSCDGSVVGPGDSVVASLSFTNDTDRPMRLRISARIRGDEELGGNRVRGRRQRVRLRLEPGETVEQDLNLEVPEDAEGALLADCKVKGRGLKARLEHGLFAEGDRPDGAPERPEPEEFAGTVALDEETDPPSLTLDVAGAESYRLVGPESRYLGKLMSEAELAEIEATLEGVVLERPADGEPNALEVDLPLLLVLGFDSDEIDDPRESLVRFHPVLHGRDSLITEAETLVVSTDEDWQALLDRAGIELPEPPEGDLPPEGDGPPEADGPDGDQPIFGRGRHGKHGRHRGPPGPKRPPITDIDFEVSTLLAIFAGEQPAGYHIRVLSVETKDEGGSLCRYSVDAMKGPAPAEDAAAIHPFVVLAIEKTDEEVEFLLVD